MMESGKAMKPMSCSSPATKMSCTSSSGRPHGHRHLARQVGAALAMPGQHAAAQFHHAGKILMLVR